MITYAELFQFCSVIIAIIALVYEICKNNKK